MPYAFFHITFAWLLTKLYCFFRKIKIDSFGWFLIIFGSVLPDIDYLLEWVLHLQAHRLFTHSLLMLFAIFILSFFVFWFMSSFHAVPKNKVLFYTGCFVFGVFSHILLDFVVSFKGGVPLFWPNTDFYGLLSGVKTYAELNNFNFMDSSYLYSKLKWAILDMALGVSFVFYMIYDKKLKEL